jgi:hypothetical protein
MSRFGLLNCWNIATRNKIRYLGWCASCEIKIERNILSFEYMGNYEDIISVNNLIPLFQFHPTENIEIIPIILI